MIHQRGGSGLRHCGQMFWIKYDKLLHCKETHIGQIADLYSKPLGIINDFSFKFGDRFKLYILFQGTQCAEELNQYTIKAQGKETYK